jgi:hypothetical protein
MEPWDAAYPNPTDNFTRFSGATTANWKQLQIYDSPASALPDILLQLAGAPELEGRPTTSKLVVCSESDDNRTSMLVIPMSALPPRTDAHHPFFSLARVLVSRLGRSASCAHPWAKN